MSRLTVKTGFQHTVNSWSLTAPPPWSSKQEVQLVFLMHLFILIYMQVFEK